MNTSGGLEGISHFHTLEEELLCSLVLSPRAASASAFEASMAANSVGRIVCNIPCTNTSRSCGFMNALAESPLLAASSNLTSFCLTLG